MKFFALIPALIVILSHALYKYPLKAVEFFVFCTSIILFCYFNEYQVKTLPKTEKKTEPEIEPMKEHKLFLETPKRAKTSAEDSTYFVRLSRSFIDCSLETPKIEVHSMKKKEELSVKLLPRSHKKAKSPVLNISNQVNRHREEFFSQLKQKIPKNDIPVLPQVQPLFEEIKKYNSQLLVREVKEIKVVPGAKKRIIIEPQSEDYQKEIGEKMKSYRLALEDSTKIVKKDILENIKGIVSQITSDLDDVPHLNGRIQAMIDILKELNSQALNAAVYKLSEAVVERGADQADSIDLGANFAMNYTKFILTIAKSYPQIHEIYFLAIIRKKYLFFPLVKQENLEEISKRNELKDLNPVGKLNEGERDKLTRSCDLSRAFGFLLGTLFASKDSNFNEGDIWRYLSYILNLKIEFVDRAYMPFLLGFVKSSAGRLKNCYGKQFVKLARFLNGAYLENLNKKFGGSPYLRAYITQLRELFSKIIN